jgi:hypothetical protein
MCASWARRSDASLRVLPLLLLLPTQLVACAERPIDGMLAAYDGALDDHYERLGRQYERDELPPPTRAEFDDDRAWVLGDGTASRACFQRLGDSRAYRKDGFWGCVQDYIEDEEQGLPSSMRNAEKDRKTFDLPDAPLHLCAMRATPGEEVPWRDCWPDE